MGEDYAGDYGPDAYGSSADGGEQPIPRVNIGVGQGLETRTPIPSGGTMRTAPTGTFGMEFGKSFSKEPARVYTAGPFRPASVEHRASKIATDYPALLSLSRLYARMARDEIERLEAACPNDPDRAETNRRQRDLLTALAGGFAKIAAALEAVTKNPDQPLLLGKASEIVREVGEQIATWWKVNTAEAVDWAVRMPVFVASLPLLGWAGADMTVATAAMAAMIGGPKVANALASRKKQEK